MNNILKEIGKMLIPVLITFISNYFSTLDLPDFLSQNLPAIITGAISYYWALFLKSPAETIKYLIK